MIRCARVRQFLALVLSFLLTPIPVWAFEIETHSDITGAAFDRSAVSDAFQDLGVDPQRPLRGGVFRGPRPPRRWLQQGSRDEDDTLSTNFARYRNHFYDPVNNRGLTATAFGVIPIRGQRAPDWALEDQEEFFTQAFSYRDARLAFHTALIAGAPLDRETALASTFEILGHVIHPLQDMASPPHTRNDIHGGFGFGPTSLFERYLDQEQVRPRLNFGGTPVRLDLPRHYWTTGDGRGLAEFVNRNFVSEGTNFTTRVEGAIGGGYPNPVLRLGADDQGRSFETTLDIQTQLEPGLRDRNGNLIDGSVSFFANNFQDPITGSALRNERMTTLSLFDRELERTGAALVFTLNRYNIEAQAAFLIPRAVGYSAGLLDYFFRGRLDVDLVEGPSGSSQFQLIGTNGSRDETLVDGELRLYADTPSGERSQVTTFAPLRVSGVDPGQPLTPIPPSFEPPTDAERFVAVYTGKLGEETPSGAFPGGVVGKVLGGVRVEEVFSDGTRWRLRTPKGVFLLQGLTAAEFEEVRWGDGDSLLVARTPFGPGQPNRVAAYEVGRKPGFMELVTVNTPDGPEVPVVEKNEAAFPFGMSLDTTVEFSQTIQYKQLVPTFQVTGIYEYVPIPGQPEAINYIGPTLEFTPLQIGTPVSQTVRPAQSFPITLDLARHADFGTIRRPYVWYLQDVAASASGRLLGLVLVFLTEPEVPRVSLPLYGLNPSTGPEVTRQVDLTPSFPSEVDPLLWAVVDLKEGRVVASTAEAVITISTEEGRETFLEVPRLGAIVAGHGLEAYNGGPLAGIYDRGWFALPFVSPEGLPPIGELTELPPSQGGILAISADGWLRGDLKDELGRLGLSTFQMNARQVSGDSVYLCLPTSCKAIRHMTTVSEVVRSPATLEDARRSRPVPEGERVVFLTGSGTAGPTLLVWDPETPKAKVVHQFPASEGPALGPTTHTTAMILSFVLQGEMLLPSTMLITLDGSKPPTAFPGEDLSLSFALLDQSYLYHVGELKFYRPKPPLQPTALPARLADVPGNPVGDYHAIRLP